MAQGVLLEMLDEVGDGAILQRVAEPVPPIFVYNPDQLVYTGFPEVLYNV